MCILALSYMIKAVIFYVNFSTRFFHTCCVCRHHSPRPFYATFSGLYLGLGQQGQQKTKPVGIFFFFIRYSSTWIYVMSPVWLAIHPDILRGKSFDVGHYMQTFQQHFFPWLLPFYAAFTDLDLAWGSQGQHKAKPLGFIFSQIFQLMRMKFDLASLKVV